MEYEIKHKPENIFIKKMFNDKDDIKEIMLCLHGFSGDKNSGTIAYVADHLIKYGIGSFAIDFPCHGDSNLNHLRVCDCIEYIDVTIKHLREKYPNKPISIFATSFGGFITLLYLNKNYDYFNNIVLRAPAINMKKSFCKVLKELNIDPKNLSNDKTIEMGFDKKIRIDQTFYMDLIKYDPMKLPLEIFNIINIIYCSKDELVDIKDIFTLSEKCDCVLHKLDAPHHFSDEKTLNQLCEIMENILCDNRSRDCCTDADITKLI